VDHIELIVFGLLVAIAALAVLAGLLRVPYPVTLVAGGAVIGFLPGVPDVSLDPDLVLLIFLPPLLYGAAFFTSLRDLLREVLSAERDELLALRNEGYISDDVRRRVERDLDLEESRLGT
jgi:NhaP-type Na+/H+ or K+/H+ antiporter